MQKDKNSTLSGVFIGLWPIFSLATLFITDQLVDPIRLSLQFSDNLDRSFFVYLALVLFGHVLAFVITPWIFLRRTKYIYNKSILIIIGTMGVLTISLQVYLRHVANAFMRLDCGDSCDPVGIPSVNLGSAVNSIVLGVLVILLIGVLLISYRKYRNGLQLQAHSLEATK